MKPGRYIHVSHVWLYACVIGVIWPSSRSCANRKQLYFSDSFKEQWRQTIRQQTQEGPGHCSCHTGLLPPQPSRRVWLAQRQGHLPRLVLSWSGLPVPRAQENSEVSQRLRMSFTVKYCAYNNNIVFFNAKQTSSGLLWNTHKPTQL